MKEEGPVEELDDETLAAILAADTDPLASVASVARAAGLSDDAAKMLIHNVRQRYAPVERELREVKVGQLVKLLENLAFDALTGITPEELKHASPKDKAIIAAVAIDKRALLRGEPTTIISVEERKNLGELQQALLSEIRRRNLVVENIDDDIVVIDPTPMPKPQPKPIHHINRERAIEKMIETGELSELTRSVSLRRTLESLVDTDDMPAKYNSETGEWETEGRNEP